MNKICLKMNDYYLAMNYAKLSYKSVKQYHEQVLIIIS